MHGYAVREAFSDVGSWFHVSIAAESPFTDDPLVNIKVDRLAAQLVGEEEPSCCDFIEKFRASDLDALVTALQAAIAAGRGHGMLPPASGLAPGLEAYEKMKAADQRRTKVSGA